MGEGAVDIEKVKTRLALAREQMQERDVPEIIDALSDIPRLIRELQWYRGYHNAEGMGQYTPREEK